MKTPFKMKGSPMARNFGISPAKQVQGKPLSESSKKAMEMIKQNRENYPPDEPVGPKSGDGKPTTGKTYQQAWDSMNDTEKTKHGTFGNFKSAAEKYNKENS